MLMNENLFIKILKTLEKEEILQNLVLIGSWVLPVYRVYFNNSNDIPLLRTTDLDFIIFKPEKIYIKKNLSKLLLNLDFELQHSALGDFEKFVHPDLEIEFLIPEKGRGKDKAQKIEQLNISAQPLRYLNFLCTYIINVQFEKIKINVPEPAVFTLMKYLISIKRRDEIKRKKDIYTAEELSKFLLSSEDQKVKLGYYFYKMTNKWQKQCLKTIKEINNELFLFLSNFQLQNKYF